MRVWGLGTREYRIYGVYRGVTSYIIEIIQGFYSLIPHEHPVSHFFEEIMLDTMHSRNYIPISMLGVVTMCIAIILGSTVVNV